MKTFVFILAFLIVPTLALSQTPFENPSFESWENTGAPEQEPTEYSSLKTADQLGGSAPQVLWRSTTAHSGSYSAQLVVAAFNIFAQVSPNGIMTNGQVHAEFNADNGYVFTNTADSKWNTPLTLRPDSLVGWYQYTPQGGDQGKIEVLLHDDTELGRLPATTVTSHWVGKARVDITSAASSWTRFSIPFNYYNNTYPDYILMVATAGDSTIAVTGSELLLDDIELIYNPLTVTVSPSTVQNLDINTNGTTLTATETTSANVTTTITREWKYSLQSGGPYDSTFVPAETGATYTPNFANPGIYYVVCETNFGIDTVVSNEVEIVVVDPASNSVTISPSSSQTLLTGQDGNVLTANESPSAATSREWLYSTTSGSGYGSFAPAETATTLTPNFSTLGTYYVICESDFSGDVQTSNEVIIYVPSSAGINNDELSFKIYKQHHQIVVNYSNYLNSSLQLYDLTGKLVYQESINGEVTTHPAPNKHGIYLYRVVQNDEIITGKIEL